LILLTRGRNRDSALSFDPTTEAELPQFRDPVCGRKVDLAIAFASEEHDGQRYFFDTRECHYDFLADPHRYGHVHPADDPRLEEDEVTGP